ncbi:MYB domain-containing protein [Cryptosporidium felis]|nr:MYB domain-containing protein [Cryptosporidium felis]
MASNSIQTRSWNDHLNNQNVSKGKFSSIERELIKRAVIDYIESQNWNLDEGLDNIFSTKKGKKDRHWPTIGEKLPNRSLQSIYYCAKRMFIRGKKGKWTKEEENELIKLVGNHGQKWSMFTELIGRSAASIRDKWRDLHTKVGGKTLNDGNCLLYKSPFSEELPKSKMPLVIDAFVLYCIEYYTGKFLPFKGISWKTIIESLSYPLFPVKFIKFWRKCCRELRKRQGIDLPPIEGTDLSCYNGKISQGQVRLRYVSSLYPKIKLIHGEQYQSLFSNAFSEAVKYLFETRFNYSHIDEIKYNDWPKVLSVHIPLTTLWSRIRLALNRVTKKDLHISDRISILHDKLQTKQSLSLYCEIPAIGLPQSNLSVEDGQDKFCCDESKVNSHFSVNTKRLRKIVVDLVKSQLTNKKKSKSLCRHPIEYSSLRQVLHTGNSHLSP